MISQISTGAGPELSWPPAPPSPHPPEGKAAGNEEKHPEKVAYGSKAGGTP